MKISNKNIVCFGGGTGMPALLSGLKHNPWLNISAIVSMFDNGGSSGELRDQFGILPPGDVLKCLLALSQDEPAARKLLQQRIDDPTLPKHSGGNIMLFGLEKTTGDYLKAIQTFGKILDIRGQVIPVTTEHSTLNAIYTDGQIAHGEVNVDQGLIDGKQILRLLLDPPTQASEAAVSAIMSADAIVIGPGSFYTSVLPNFLPIGIKQALQNSRAQIIFVCNLLTEGLGMQNTTVEQLISEVELYTGKTINQAIINNYVPDSHNLSAYEVEQKRPLLYNGPDENKFIQAPLWQPGAIARHHSSSLAYLIYKLLDR
ncbi:MAG: uridine diphosphate-N-acetylglucosamine-binding protein YvcK [Candidatus Doudnabacteria bacterium]